MTALFMRRSCRFSSPCISSIAKNAFIDQLRFQSSSSSEKEMKTLLPIVVRSMAGPFKFYGNLWRLSRYKANHDKTFALDEFQIGARRAFIVVTRKIYDGDFEGLRDLISDEALNQLLPAVEKVPAEKRDVFNLVEDDVYGQFLLNTAFRNSASAGEKYFDIVLAIHCFRQMKDSPASLSRLLENREKFVWANATFSRRLLDSAVDDWTITFLNYSWF